MAGTVMEMLSTRKMVMLILCLLLVQVTFFLIGGLVAPAPSYAQQTLMTSCIADKDANPVTKNTCTKEVSDLYKDTKNYGADDLVLIANIPRGLHGMTPWFQYLLGLLEVKLAYKEENKYNPNATMLLDVHIYYSNNPDREARAYPDAWTLLKSCEEERHLECVFHHSDPDRDYEDYEYECDLLHLFQFGSVPHKYYMINIRLPVYKDGKEYNRIGHTKELNVIAIRQNGGFTKVWMCLKTALALIMIFPVFWFWRRIMLLQRKPLLLEKAIFALGISMVFLNLPLELVSIFFEAPWMLFFTDLRQGLFYAVLFSFWIIFVGEHLMDQANRNKLSSYKWQLGTIFTCLMALLAFDIAERGVQLVNPCATVWTHHRFAMSLLIVASIAGCVYFLVLLYMVVKVFRVISVRQRTAPEHGKKLRTIVLRFRFLMLLSVGTAALSITFYVLSQNYDGLLDTETHKIEVSSAFFTGVYGLWNMYLFLVLSVYAPSHKNTTLMENDHHFDNRQELIQLNTSNTIETEVSDQVSILRLTQQKGRTD